MFEFDKIKIVIWDLDDTFWDGTLSEGEVKTIQENVNLVKALTDYGIVNSICSKNEQESTLTQINQIEPNLVDYFVYPSIDWTPKGQRIANMLKTLGLRPQNCLFLDDNIQNLHEAEYFNPEIMTSTPDEISKLRLELSKREPKDREHKRLKQYKVLEEKTKAAKNFANNIEFLYSSNIQVKISRDCINHIDRIVELVQRTNQLNFTKRRDNFNEIKSLIEDSECDTGYVTVTDNFGDYGMVGFFAIKEKECIHFLFSCRTIGQGVEEYVYASLGYPKLTTVEPVINHLSDSPAPKWINQLSLILDKESNKSTTKVVFKGACDLSQISIYLRSDNIIEEFTYIGRKRHNYIEHHNHSTNYLQWWKLNEIERNKLVSELVFNDEEMFNTNIYDKDTKIIILSTMIEPHLGIYRSRINGFEIAFGDANHPMTDPKEWQYYTIISDTFKSEFLNEQWLEKFSQEFEYLGHLSIQQIINNARELLNYISPDARVCYILGPEIPCENETYPSYIGREIIYRDLNIAFRKLHEKNPRILLIDSNDYIHSQADFTNNINHWRRDVYFRMAKVVNEYINEYTSIQSKKKNILYLHYLSLRDKICGISFLRKMWYKLTGKNTFLG